MYKFDSFVLFFGSLQMLPSSLVVFYVFFGYIYMEVIKDGVTFTCFSPDELQRHLLVCSVCLTFVLLLFSPLLSRLICPTSRCTPTLPPSLPRPQLGAAVRGFVAAVSCYDVEAPVLKLLPPLRPAARLCSCPAPHAMLHRRNGVRDKVLACLPHAAHLLDTCIPAFPAVLSLKVQLSKPVPCTHRDTIECSEACPSICCSLHILKKTHCSGLSLHCSLFQLLFTTPCFIMLKRIVYFL